MDNKAERAKKIIVAVCQVLDNHYHRFDVMIECDRKGCTFYFSVKSFGLMAILPPELLDWRKSLIIDNAKFYAYTDEYLIAYVTFQVSRWLQEDDYKTAYENIQWAQV